MYEFLDRLVTIALPRVRDFRGLNPKSFDGRGNYALGIKEHLVFPEINYDKVEQVWGMDVVIARLRRPTTRPAHSCATSTSRSGSENIRSQTRTLEKYKWLKKALSKRTSTVVSW